MKIIIKVFVLISIIVFSAGCANVNVSDIEETTIGTVDIATEQHEHTISDNAIEDITTDTFFIGAKIDATNMSANQINNKLWLYASFFCADDDGNIFYTNFSDGGSLYLKNKSENIKISEAKAYSPSYNQGKVYFISPETEITDMNIYGKVYVYDMRSRDISLFIDGNVTYLNAYADGIYYYLRDDENANKMILNYMEYEGEGKRCYYPLPLVYGNYVINNKGLYDISDDRYSISEENVILFDKEFNGGNSCIYNNMLCYKSLGKNIVEIINLENGKKTSITDEMIEATLNEEKISISDFTIVDDIAYLSIWSENIIKWDYKSGSIEMIYNTKPDGKILKYLYTDADNLYSMRCDVYGNPIDIVDNNELLIKEISK